MTAGSRAVARVDLTAVRGNVAALREHARGAEVMAVVKADAYGHGMVPCARAALDGGATWLGVATAQEALDLRTAGITAPVLCWLLTPAEDVRPLVAAGVDVGVGSLPALARAAAAAGPDPARVHLEADTGLGRGGTRADGWADLVEAAARGEADGSVEVVGVWSHLARADEPGHPTVARQTAAYAEALAVAGAAGLRPRLRHLANSPATLTAPETHYDLVRTGIAVYGLSPVPGVPADAYGLTPAMTLAAEVTMTKRLGPGDGVSYGHRWTAEVATGAAVVPLGYADGVPRAATNARGLVLLGGRRRDVAGTVCMDQFVVATGDDDVQEGDEVVLFGPGRDGEPTADDWAAATGTINYEIVTRIGARVPRVHT